MNLNKLQRVQLGLWMSAVVLAIIGLIFSGSMKITGTNAAASYVFHLMSVSLMILSGYVILNFRKNVMLCAIVANIAVFYTEFLFLMLPSSGNQTELFSLLLSFLLSIYAFTLYHQEEENPKSKGDKKAKEQALEEKKDNKNNRDVVDED